jgi:hypothetical protein
MQVHGELAWADGTLSCLDADGKTLWQRANAKAQPYQVVCVGRPALVTTLSETLTPTTWAVGSAGVITAYPDNLPQMVRPPLVALAGMRTEAHVGLAGLTLLAPDGTAIYQQQGVELLWPVAADPAYAAQPDVAYVVEGSGDDPVFPYGSQPLLIAVDCGSGAEKWRIDLGATAPVAGVDLWCVGQQWGLLSLQYDYRVFDFLRLALPGEQPGPRWQLDGQPQSGVVFPGPADEPLGIVLNGDILTLPVIEQSVGRQNWVFELPVAQLLKEPGSVPQSITREENATPLGGSGPPDVNNPPFPQQLLPTSAAGQPWHIPALCDEQGRVLTIDERGASFVGASAEPPAT